MRIISATLVLLGACAAAANAQTAQPICKAEQTGNVLLTTIQFDDGYRVEAPWRVTSERKYLNATGVTAVLEHIVETDRVTHKRQTTPLPAAIQMTFKGSTAGDMMQQAAEIWCQTVNKALAARVSGDQDGPPRPRVVM